MVETRSQGKERNEEEEKIMEEVEREKPVVKEICNLSGDEGGKSELGEMTDEVYADTNCGKGNCMDKGGIAMYNEGERKGRNNEIDEGI